MAQLILGAAGAVIGTMTGVGPGVGWAVGSMIGGAVFGSPTQKVQGQQQALMDLRVLGTEYGQAIPYVVGCASVAGQMWWNTDRRPTTETTTSNSGGKGGGGTEVTSSTISYDMDCLIGISDNPIIGVARIWMNGEIIWTALNSATPNSRAASAASDKWKRISIYTGNDAQMPDPTYEAAVGLENACAYRGRGYVFIEGLKLGQSGAVPNLTFEVAARGSFYSLWFGEVDTYATYDQSKGTNNGAWFGNPGYMGANVPPYIKNGNLIYIQGAYSSFAWASGAPTAFASKGKLYCEFQLLDNVGGVGLCNELWRPDAQGVLGQTADSYGIFCEWMSGYYQGTWKTHNGIKELYRAGLPYFMGGRVGMMLDFDARTLSFSMDGTPFGIAYQNVGQSGSGSSWGPAGMVQDWKYGSGCVLITDPADMLYDPGGYGYWKTTATGGNINAAPIITPEQLWIADVVGDLCVRAGLTDSQLDVTALQNITRPVRSLAIGQITPTRTPLELLMTAYFFEMVVSDKIYFRPRGGATVANIPYNDLDAGESNAEPLALLQASELEIPAQIALTYINIEDDYQTDTQYSDRLLSAVSGTVATVQLAIGLPPDHAKAIVDVMLADQAASVISTTIRLLGDYCRLEPTDAVNVAGAAGESYRLRLVKKTDSYPVLQFDAVVDVAAVIVSPGVTSLDYISSNEVLFPAVTLLELMDIPILSESDNDGGFYAAAKGEVVAWPGAAVFQSANDIEYSRKATIPLPAVFGECTTTLGAWGGGRAFDETNSVTVNVGNGELQSTTRDALLNSQTVNAMMVGSEFVQYRTASLIAAGVYKLTGLLRGGRGTEWSMAGHQPNERCVALSAGGIARIPMPNSDIGLARFYKGVTLGGALSSATGQSFVDSAVGLKPFSPVNVRVVRDSANNIALTWQRRTRLSVRMIGALGISVPLGEDSESYDVEIFADDTFATVVRTIWSPTANCGYGVDVQSADGLTPGAPINGRIYQKSASIGRGYPLEFTA